MRNTLFLFAVFWFGCVPEPTDPSATPQLKQSVRRFFRLVSREEPDGLMFWFVFGACEDVARYPRRTVRAMLAHEINVHYSHSTLSQPSMNRVDLSRYQGMTPQHYAAAYPNQKVENCYTVADYMLDQCEVVMPLGGGELASL